MPDFPVVPFRLDVLPAHSQIEMQVNFANQGCTGYLRVRFRVTRPRRFRRKQTSDWSGWFSYEGEPIALTWDAFWVKQ